MDHKIVGNSVRSKMMLKLAEHVAPSDTVVLIDGENGTGKGLLASYIHDLSSRAERPMVSVNCAAMPAVLVESELFGRERGVHTGTLFRQPGCLELANGSTLFLDEIDVLPREIQGKLMRVIERGRFERLGSLKALEADVRIIASTNRNLEEAVQRGEFRADLFYRLNIFPIHVPPLRQRAEDVPALVWQFVEQFCQSMGKRIEEIPTPSMKRLQQYDWPGNIRELRNFIERLLIMNVGSSLNVDLAILESGLDTPPPTLNTSHPAASSHLSLAEVRRQHILRVLQSTGWRIRGPKGAARYLGCAESSLRSRMKQLGIVKPQPYRAHPRN